MVAYFLLALTPSLPCPHRVSIGFNFGDRFGSHNSVIPSGLRRQAFAMWRGASPGKRATCAPPVVPPNVPEERPDVAAAPLRARHHLQHILTTNDSSALPRGER